MLWVKYRNKRGSLNSGTRIEQELSRLRALYLNVRSPKDSPLIHAEDLNPSMDARVITLEELTAQMGQ